MSGYLRRLASSAQASRVAIRPVRGSLFSASTYEGAAEPFQEVREVVVSGPTRFLAMPRRQSPQAVQQRPPAFQLAPALRPAGRGLPLAPTRTPAAQVADQGEGPRPIPEARTPFEPLVTGVPRGDSPAPKTSDEGIMEKPVAITGSGPDQPAFPRRAYRQLLTESLTGAASQDLRLSGPSKFDIREGEKTETSRRASRSEREADEIQIHIGRIEVTAVPPVAAHPEPKPARKSLNLGEYLRSGRGSAQ